MYGKKCIICKTNKNNSLDCDLIEMRNVVKGFYKLPSICIYERISRLVISAGVVVGKNCRPGLLYWSFIYGFVLINQSFMLKNSF